MTMVGDTTLAHGARRIHWSGIVAGAVMAVMVQLLLTLLGIGIGALSFDRATDAATGSWVAFLWWAISGIVAAFIGGWFAGRANAGEVNGSMQGLGAWAVSALIVIGATSAVAAGTAGVLANVAGPVIATVIGDPNVQIVPGANAPGAQTTGAGANVSAPQAETAKKHAGSLMLATFIALVLGGIAGLLGGRMGAETTTPVRARM